MVSAKKHAPQETLPQTTATILPLQQLMALDFTPSTAMKPLAMLSSLSSLELLSPTKASSKLHVSHRHPYVLQSFLP